MIDPEGTDALSEDAETPEEHAARIAVAGLRSQDDHRARLVAVMDGTLAPEEFVQDIVDRVEFENAGIRANQRQRSAA